MIDDEGFGGGFVETEFFFDGEGGVDLEGDGEDGLCGDEDADECEAADDFVF